MTPYIAPIRGVLTLGDFTWESAAFLRSLQVSLPMLKRRSQTLFDIADMPFLPLTYTHTVVLLSICFLVQTIQNDLPSWAFDNTVLALVVGEVSTNC